MEPFDLDIELGEAIEDEEREQLGQSRIGQ